MVVQDRHGCRRWKRGVECLRGSGSARRSSIGAARLGALLVFSLAGCSEERSNGEVQSARPGIEQAADADGPLLDSEQTCQRLFEALTGSAEDLACDGDDVGIDECPSLVSLHTSPECVQYSEQSLESCEEAIADYESCADFAARRCVLVAVTQLDSEPCLAGLSPDAGSANDGELDAGDPDSGVDGDDTGDAEDAGDASSPPEAGSQETEAGTVLREASAPMFDAAAGTNGDADSG